MAKVIDVTKATIMRVPVVEETNQELLNQRAKDGADDNPYSKEN